jgi:crotonobetainyl-CoA:carnitine CoA-transferase CaiB-like acyl-CoA transferase
MVALHSGVGQVVDANLLESMLQVMGPLPAAYAVLGYEQPRLGSGIPYSVPRGTYRCADGSWVAISTSSEPVARRLLDLVGLGDDEGLRTNAGRAARREEVDRAVGAWIGARAMPEALESLNAADVAVAPVMGMADILGDPHVAARRAVLDVEGTPMQGVVARLSATPGRIRWSGRPLGADNEEVLGPPAGPA